MRLFIAFLSLQLFLATASEAASLDDVLAQMDAAAASFTGVKADVRKASFTAIINDEGVESGTMWMSVGSSRKRAVQLRIDFTDPDPKSVAFQGRRAEIYYPKIETVHEYDLGKHQKLVEEFLLLGFGTSGKQLTEDFNIKLVGEDQVAGVTAHELELIPKSKDMREQVLRVELWTADGDGYPVQQKFYWPSDDTNTFTYTNIEINPSLTEKDLSLDLPEGVKREYPQR